MKKITFFSILILIFLGSCSEDNLTEEYDFSVPADNQSLNNQKTDAKGYINLKINGISNSFNTIITNYNNDNTIEIIAVKQNSLNEILSLKISDNTITNIEYIKENKIFSSSPINPISSNFNIKNSNKVRGSFTGTINLQADKLELSEGLFDISYNLDLTPKVFRNFFNLKINDVNRAFDVIETQYYTNDLGTYVEVSAKETEDSVENIFFKVKYKNKGLYTIENLTYTDKNGIIYDQYLTNLTSLVFHNFNRILIGGFIGYINNNKGESVQIKDNIFEIKF